MNTFMSAIMSLTKEIELEIDEDMKEE